MTWAERVADLAIRVAPEARRDWALAARAELEHVPAFRSLGFALGGLAAAIGWRVGDPSFLTFGARWGLAAGMMLWAGLLVRLALKLTAVDAAFATGVGMLGLVAGVGAILTAWLGLGVVIRAGAPLLALTVGYAGLVEHLAPDYPYLRYCRALSIEIAVLLAAAIGVATLVRAYGLKASQSS
ncbi:transporter [Caulobacter sp. RL271]|jgi:hypothetical protein|uniref:Transporter n=1 Tax=Caulobacter segnis TaxID=88688 RepID=A0ABY4ZYB1_9CAUL|nr:transporter [Caulobacter segnis]USQ96957.1 transporter [Caulobacter segnis]